MALNGAHRLRFPWRTEGGPKELSRLLDEKVATMAQRRHLVFDTGLGEFLDWEESTILTASVKIRAVQLEPPEPPTQHPPVVKAQIFHEFKMLGGKPPMETLLDAAQKHIDKILNMMKKKVEPTTSQADMVFVNYGRRKDMDQLEENGVEVEGRICLARFGGAHPVDKCRNCHERGGVGLLVFADPEDVAPLGPLKVYPDTAFVDGSALQRGSLYHYGDPETPGYPSVDKALRGEDSNNLAPIPALVIGYDDADVFLKSLGGEQLGWKGGLNDTYKTGPLFPEGRKIQMSVSSTRVTRVVKSVLGIVRGSGEPDRFVITGAHHDSWGYGAIEPSSATAALLELGRALGALIKRGWAPRRTIVLASWAAGQMAFAGSSEWVE
ncbi:N-acetylated-alpha-linked acidic dipeptidase 2-like, partial [Rhipicephalus sanguineus]|uniref:N-acetylated-alpha-linked acidic dipeptidase 2-like n=1 Tax=Rhipicephalus sanguineus TaxID=34632 RepID=UPI0020C418BA